MASYKETPMISQYLGIKRQHGDSLLFFRLGDFYELFFEDAKIASRELGLTLTSRSKGPNAVPMAGVPFHAAESYIKRLVTGGYRVAVCDQVQDADEAKGLVEREVIRVYSAGTITELGMLDERQNNYLAAVLPGESLVGLAWADLSTGEFYVDEIEPSRLAGAFVRLGPTECLLPRVDDDTIYNMLKSAISDCQITSRPGWTFRQDTGRDALENHFGTATLEGFGCEDLSVGIGAAATILRYLQETQKSSLGQITQIKRFRSEEHIFLDEATQRNLELVERLRDGARQHSLIDVMDRTVNPMGARMLRKWMLSPLRQRSAICRRLEAVGVLKSNTSVLKNLRDILKEVYDLERLAVRVAAGRAHPRDLVALGRSLEKIPAIRETLPWSDVALLGEVYRLLDPVAVEDAVHLIARSITDNPPITVKEGGILREGYDPEVDELRRLAFSGKSWIAAYQKKLASETGISTLKVGYNRVFGYYIEVTHANQNAVPETFVRKQTLKNAERYITPELKEYEHKVLSAEERLKELEQRRFLEIREKVAFHVPAMLSSASALAQLDALLGLARLAEERAYVQPEILQDAVFDVLEGRHPVVEATLQGRETFVPNDVVLGKQNGSLMIITGPNMAGKSTYIRQVAVITLMAHMGSFVPAKSARIGLVDGIFTRIGASDDLAGGKSTFMVEMSETANILNHATDKSLVILDEVGRGTSTFDGISIAWAVTEFLSRAGARTLFATHYHELTELSRTMTNVTSWNVAVKEWEGEVVFLHQIVPGATDKSYGIHVARLCGVPAEVIERSKEIMSNLENAKLDADDLPKLAKSPNMPQAGGDMQLDLFSSPYQELADKIRSMKLDSMTPLEAMNLLADLKKSITREDE